MVHKHVEIPTIGIPFNIMVAVVVGVLVGWRAGVPTELIPDLMVFGLAAGFFIQELFLIQIMSNEANVQFQERLLKGETTGHNRRIVLLVPFISISILGLLILLFSERGFDTASILRIASVAFILTLGLDPLLGLADRGPLAIFGATLVYIIVIHAGISGYTELSESLYNVIGKFSAVAFSSAVLSYLLLSTRWTYYRLFCFNQIHEWRRVIIDTVIPLTIIVIPSIPQFISVISSAFVGN